MRADPPQRPARKQVIRQESSGKRAVEQSRARLLCILVFFALAFSGIGFRLLEVASSGKPEATAFLAIPNSDPGEGAREEEIALEKLTREPSALRGDITDRNGVLLATSLATASLYANPRVMTNPDEAAQKLAGVFPVLGVKALRAKLDQTKSFVWIKRNLTPREQQQVNTLGIPGIYFQPEERRIYPQGAMLCHVLGYVGIDNKGLSGIEQYFDRRLRDGEKNRSPLALSIDLRLQSIVHEEISRGMEEFQAIGATGIVMDLASGEILAMANLPEFDPHHPARAKEEQRFNRAALGTYEMGSTFKTFTMAMGLDYGVTTMQGGYDASHPIKVGKFTISDAHPENRFLTVPEIYAYSSNIGTVRMALDVGTARQKEFLEKLGLMKQVEIELPERSKPQYPNPWREISTMTIAYGHGMSVSPLHLVRAIGSIVGDGRLKNLTLLRDGNKQKAEGARVVSERTAKQIRHLMRLVVQHGTGSKADIAGYRVGGKTGTAEKVQGKSYNANAKMALFVSTFPVDDPKYVMLVMMDEPKPTKATYGFATGGWNAAPVAGRIISRMSPLYAIRPIYDLKGDDSGKNWARGAPADDDGDAPVLAESETPALAENDATAFAKNTAPALGQSDAPRLGQRPAPRVMPVSVTVSSTRSFDEIIHAVSR